MKPNSPIVTIGIELVRRAMWFPLALFVVNIFLSYVLFAYSYFPRLDRPMHVLGGIAIAYSVWRGIDVLVNSGFLERVQPADSPRGHVEQGAIPCRRTLEAVMGAVHPYADYLAVNISSPNTPGLRDLQGGDYLGHMLRELQAENGRLSQQIQSSLQSLTDNNQTLHEIHQLLNVD